MPTDLETYRQTLIDLYLRLPDTPRRLSRFDLRLVRQLWERQIPLTTVETAFLLASSRRAARRPDAMPLGPIRSLHYFVPVIEELLAQAVPAVLSCLPAQQSYPSPRNRQNSRHHGLTFSPTPENRPLFKFIRF